MSAAVAASGPLSARERAILRDRIARARLREQTDHRVGDSFATRDDLLPYPEDRLYAAIEAKSNELKAKAKSAETLKAIRKAEPERRRLIEEAPDLIECACGCGELLERLDARGRPRRFLSGHNVKLAKREPLAA